MNIEIICVGKLKEKYWTDAVNEYSKRLKPYCSLSITEIKESKLQGETASYERIVKEEEGRDILAKIPKDSFVITLEIRGKRMSSEDLAKKINALGLGGHSDICFVIGGSLGLSEEVSDRADLKLSFSDMTFPHQMMRVILLEQIYRSYKINRGETYHK